MFIPTPRIALRHLTPACFLGPGLGKCVRPSVNSGVRDLLQGVKTQFPLHGSQTPGPTVAGVAGVIDGLLV